MVPKFEPLTKIVCFMTGEALEGYTFVIVGIPYKE